MIPPSLDTETHQGNKLGCCPRRFCLFRSPTTSPPASIWTPKTNKPLIQIAVKHTSSVIDQEYIIKPREHGMSLFRKSWGRGDKSEPKAEPEKSSTQVTQAATKPGPGSDFPFEEMMRARYHDSAKLKTSLDSIYGQGNYKVKERANRFILMLPKPLKEGELAAIEQRIRVHYSD
ncbi:hypothetical protein JMJ77_0010618 [Colletotrichum scovillei]|uniref:Uncharacterized protein n=2 Tax=Colletotrichum scovillei TaxID=1209932 RepID=A0A9P7R2Y8_9PEZI|nr:hypothetical protein JMJ77_0010618 [Colletotrichum scovillei]KAG7059580.1 hypothetical protein JMJ78_0014871 [Colletotrichum scovillei]KAG7067029.1 hypothetical protein JMJ76_0008474 [Colletotrichum scovillei]